MNYKYGKIYKLVSHKTDMIYIGSTCNQYLSQRLASHKQDIKRGKNSTAKKILKHGDARIILIEAYPCKNRDELRSREEYYRKKYRTTCVKVRRSFITDQEKKVQADYFTNHYNKQRVICMYCGDEISYRHYHNLHCKTQLHKDNVEYANMIYKKCC